MFQVANCSACPILVPEINQLNASCVQDQNASWCECEAPFVSVSGHNLSGYWVPQPSDNHCHHSYAFPGVLIINHLPLPLFVYGLVYIVQLFRVKCGTARSTWCNSLTWVVALAFLFFLTRILFLTVDPQSVWQRMHAGINRVLIRVGYLWAMTAMFIMVDAWFNIILTLPLSSLTTPDHSADDLDKHRRTDLAQSIDNRFISSCIYKHSFITCRRATLITLGATLTFVDMAGLFLIFDSPEARIAGLTAQAFVQLVTIVVWLFIIVTWASAGLLLLKSIGKLLDTTTEVVVLATILKNHLVSIVVTFVVYIGIASLNTYVGYLNPYSYALILALNRVGNFLIVHSLLRMVDGTGSQYFATSIWTKNV